MIGAQLAGVEFLLADTDAQALEGSSVGSKVLLGQETTRGLGAGARPDAGRSAAEEARQALLHYLQWPRMAFVVAGLGGGTGTGAAPVIARTARDSGILTVGVVTRPFPFEGAARMRLADAGIAELQRCVDSLIVIPNQNLLRGGAKTSGVSAAFGMIDEAIHFAVRSITDLMVVAGFINVDFADIRAIMSDGGKAMMGTGEADGEQRAIAAAEAALHSPFLEGAGLRAARGTLINVTGGSDVTLLEVDEAVKRVREEVNPEATIVFGSVIDPSIEGRMRVSIVATGTDAQQARHAAITSADSLTDSDGPADDLAVASPLDRPPPVEQSGKSPAEPPIPPELSRPPGAPPLSSTPLAWREGKIRVVDLETAPASIETAALRPSLADALASLGRDIARDLPANADRRLVAQFQTYAEEASKGEGGLNVIRLDGIYRILQELARRDEEAFPDIAAIGIEAFLHDHRVLRGLYPEWQAFQRLSRQSDLPAIPDEVMEGVIEAVSQDPAPEVIDPEVPRRLREEAAQPDSGRRAPSIGPSVMI